MARFRAADASRRDALVAARVVETPPKPRPQKLAAPSASHRFLKAEPLRAVAKKEWHVSKLREYAQLGKIMVH